MKTMLVLLAAMLICDGTAQARLGETEAQIEARFGKPVDGDKEPRDGILGKLYVSRGIRVLIFYIDGKSAAEGYNKENLEPLSETEVQTLLEANAQGQNSWAATNQLDFTKKYYKRSDGQASAVDTRIGRHPGLLIASRQWTEAAQNSTHKQEKKNLSGF